MLRRMAKSEDLGKVEGEYISTLQFLTHQEGPVFLPYLKIVEKASFAILEELWVG